jgi:hypothetical protein
MYHGRSIGRMLEWLRELTPHADDLVFHPGGKITLGQDKVVIERTEWDEYDNPRFFFVGAEEGREIVKEARERAYREIRENEFRRMCYTLHAEHLFALRDLESSAFFGSKILRDDIPKYYDALVDLGLAEKEKKVVGWADDGSPLFDVSVKLSPQGRGFLRMYREGAK